MTTQPGTVFLESDILHDEWTKLPHALIDRLPLIATANEPMMATEPLSAQAPFMGRCHLARRLHRRAGLHPPGGARCETNPFLPLRPLSAQAPFMRRCHLPGDFIAGRAFLSRPLPNEPIFLPRLPVLRNEPICRLRDSSYSPF